MFIGGYPDPVEAKRHKRRERYTPMEIVKKVDHLLSQLEAAGDSETSKGRRLWKTVWRRLCFWISPVPPPLGSCLVLF